MDVIVVGAGHAGIEAALASARLGLNTVCVTLRLDRIGYLPCNCSIGGPAKGHLAREVDALGGQMAITADRAVTHIRQVGTGKGPSVVTLRAHVCKDLYPELMREALTQQANLRLLQDTVETVLVAGGAVAGVQLSSGTKIAAKCVVLTAGTFMNGLCHLGDERTVAARLGDRAVNGLSSFLTEIGIPLRRFKTGTTPRVRQSSLQIDRCEVMPSEPEVGPFSFTHRRLQPRSELLDCWKTRTSEATHALIRDNLHLSAMYSGAIDGIGPRYCPSIEDKVMRFADKESHPVFLEVETWTGEEVYVQGVSTSLPADVQLAILKTIPGMEAVDMIRPGYAVEYDVADPLWLTPSLMSKQLPGLFLAGQLNGTSGYEEAAGQGLLAGINAARYASNLPSLVLERHSSFLGVMIDDLVTKGVDDPYRMLTARAEHRLLLRSDNADIRLTPIAESIGLCGDERSRRFSEKLDAIASGRQELDRVTFSPADTTLFAAINQPVPSERVALFELLRRPGFTLEDAARLCELKGINFVLPEDAEARQQLTLAAKFAGYLKRQEGSAAADAKLSGLAIPDGFSYVDLLGLSHESREKLDRVRPATVGQASRIPGVRMSDVALLMGHIRHRKGLMVRPSREVAAGHHGE